MIIKTLGISTSPRIKGNSDLLLREAKKLKGDFPLFDSRFDRLRSADDWAV